MALKPFPMAPQLPELLEDFQIDTLFSLSQHPEVPDGITVGPYLHWEQLRHKALPTGLETHRQWWAATKLRRSVAARELPLQDAGGRPFRFCLTDTLQRRLSGARNQALFRRNGNIPTLFTALKSLRVKVNHTKWESLLALLFP